MTTATEAPIVTNAAPPAAIAPAAPAATSVPAGQPAGAVATPVDGKPAVVAGATAPVETGKTGLLADPAPAAVDTKPVEITLKAPEGQTIDDATLRAVEAFAKDAGLSQAQAEKILARETKGRTEAETAWKTAQAAEVAKVGDTWRAEAEKHPEIGGEKLPAAIASAKRALAAWATPEERAAIANSPFANNPMFIAIMSRAAARLPAEDVVHPGSGKGGNAMKSGPETLSPLYYKSQA